jgi:hypothetical protein
MQSDETLILRRIRRATSKLGTRADDDAQGIRRARIATDYERIGVLAYAARWWIEVAKQQD